MLPSFISLCALMFVRPASQPVGPRPLALIQTFVDTGGTDTRVSPSPAVSTPLVFDGVTVIDVTNGHRLTGQRVVIVGTRIRVIGDARTLRVPRGAHVVDARGKFLIPGLWDMHTHPRHMTTFAYPLFLANGVTGIRDAWSEVPLDTLRLWRRDILAGTRVGPPRQLFAGAALDECSIEVNIGHLCVANAADARHVVDSLRAAGADFIKMYGLGKTLYFVIAAEAHRIAIPFGGHLGDPYTRFSWAGNGSRLSTSSGGWNVDSASVITASDSGASILDHWNEAGDMATRCFEDVNPAHVLMAPPRLATVPDCQPVADHFRHNGTWLAPTFSIGADAVYHTSKTGTLTLVGGTYLRTPAARALLTRYEQVDSGFRAGATLPSPWLPWLRGPTQGVPLPDRRPFPPADTIGLLMVAHRVGLPILAGTDLMLSDDIQTFKLLPGFSLQTELALYVAEGLTPLEALQSATLNPAKYLRATDSLGTVAPGKLADLVLLDADPLADITNTTTIYAVVANGRYFDRPALDQLMADAQAQVKR